MRRILLYLLSPLRVLLLLHRHDLLFTFRYLHSKSVHPLSPLSTAESDNLCGYLLSIPKSHNLQIDNYEERGEPAENTELDEMILNEWLRGTTAQTIDNHILKIA